MSRVSQTQLTFLPWILNARTKHSLSLTLQTAIKQTVVKKTATKQLLDEVEHDIMNYQNGGLCYLPQPSASADNNYTSLRARVFYEQIVNEAQPS